MSKKKIGWVLEGGAGLAFFHIGVIKELSRRGISPDYIVAVSAGALAAAKYIESGNNIELLEATAKAEFGSPPYTTNVKVFNPLSFWKPEYLYKNNKLKEIIERFNIKKILNSDIELEVLAMNLLRGEEKFFSSKEESEEVFRKSILATTSYLGFFEPVFINDEPWVDGGLTNPLPIERAVEKKCDIIFVLSCSPKDQSLTMEEIKSMGWIERILWSHRFSAMKIIKTSIAQIAHKNKPFPVLGPLLVMFDKLIKNINTSDESCPPDIVFIYADKNMLKNIFWYKQEDSDRIIKAGERIAKQVLDEIGL